MTMHDFPQRSDEWFAHRCGRLTASRVSEVTAKTRNGWSSSRSNVMAELVVERLTGVSVPGYTSAAMQWGTNTEPEARAAYEFYRDVDVREVGFVDHPGIDMFGCSPDGLVGDDGMIEVKCPQSATHIATLLGGPIPDKYIKQMQAQMACAGRQWVDFVSYDPRMPEELRLHTERVSRDDKIIAELESQAREFLEELAQMESRLRALTQKEAA